MRRIIASLLTATLATAAAATIAVPAASAQDLSEGGRIGGGSSQLISGSALPGSSQAKGELPEIEGAVDLAEYSGTWYQVAALPQPYSLQCASDTTAEYGVIDEGTISVRNSCNTLLSSDSVIEGEATVRSDASLRVNFPGVPFQDPDGPTNYRVTYLADDYSLAIVGDPQRTSGFVLSRTPALSDEQWSEVRGIVEDRGYWSCAFLTVPMAEGRGDIAPLCTL